VVAEGVAVVAEVAVAEVMVAEVAVVAEDGDKQTINRKEQ
jgi:hypothetical protein